MTDMIEAVAHEVQRAVEQMPYRDFTELTADGSAERPMTLREFFENTWQGEHADKVFSAAANVATRAAITAHTKALIEGAGDNETARWLFNLELETSDASLAAVEGFVLGGEVFKATELKALIERLTTTIAAQKAEIERLTERDAQAKLGGVRAGIEASAGQVDEHGNAWGLSYRTMTDQIANAIRALDAEAIAKGEG